MYIADEWVILAESDLFERKYAGPIRSTNDRRAIIRKELKPNPLNIASWYILKTDLILSDLRASCPLL